MRSGIDVNILLYASNISRALHARAVDFLTRGHLVPDAHLLAVLRQHGVARLCTHDRDIRKFDGLDVIDPFA